MRLGGVVVAGTAALLLGCAGSAAGSASGTAAGSAGPASRSTPPEHAAPPPGGRFDYQLGGAYPPAAGVTTVTRDRHDPPARGTYSICYVNAYQTQPEETAWWRAVHPDLVLPVEDPDWPGEFLLDLSTPAKRTAVAAVVDGWLDGCATAGFRAIEPDNLDSWTRSGGRLSAADAVAYVTLLAARAHARGLAIGQKNAAGLGSRARAAGLDFAVVEECQAHDECPAYTAVYGTAVLEIEYARAPFRVACAARRGIPVILRDRELVPAGSPGHVSESC